jgi:sec-independent protein translocase protein TatC
MRLKRKNKKDAPETKDENALITPEEAAASGMPALPKAALLAHLKALRNALIISIAAIIIGFLAVFLGVSGQLINFLKAPINSHGIDLIYLSLYEPLAIQLKVSFIAGIILASPVVFWQIWSFVLPALYPHEGRLVISLFFLTVLLFLLGAAFAYLIVFQMAITFFLVTSEGMAAPFISIEKYVNFLVGFVLPFGLTFELPVVMVVLTRTGLVTVRFFTKCRKYIIFLIFILAAVLTPPDVISQVALALPLIVLFETGIIVSRITQKRAEKRQAMRDNA